MGGYAIMSYEFTITQRLYTAQVCFMDTSPLPTRPVSPWAYNIISWPSFRELPLTSR